MKKAFSIGPASKNPGSATADNRTIFRDEFFQAINSTGTENPRYFFHIELPSVQLQRRFEKFLANAADDDKVY